MAQQGNFERIKSSINRLLDAAGCSCLLPEETTVENLAENLEAIGEQLSHTMGELRLQLEQLTEQIEQERQAARDKDRQVFEAALDRLSTEGKIAPADKPAILEVGEPAGYSLSLLAPFEKIPVGAAVPVVRIARTGADASPPSPGGRAPMTPDRAAEIARTDRQ